VSALLLDLDGTLGATRPLWDAWLESAARVLGCDVSRLPLDRGAAAVELDSAGAGNWRILLERFAEDHAPVYLRPTAEASAALRTLAARKTRVGVFTDAPLELARVALAQLGATRRVEVLETGSGALERLRCRFGDDAELAVTREELVCRAS